MDVNLNPFFNMSKQLDALNELPNIQLPKSFGKTHLAEWMCERVIKTIEDFEEDLPDNLQAGGRLVTFKDTTFSIEDVSYWNPDMIIFVGTLPDGSSVQLLQHTTQLNLLLIAVPRLDTSSPRRKIGFLEDTQEEE